MKEVVEKKKL